MSQQPKMIRPSRWPSPDSEAWDRALTAREVFDDHNAATRWATVTRQTVALSYGRWLGYLNELGMLDGTPGSRVTPEAVAGYVAHLRATVQPTTVLNYTKHLFDAIRAMTPDQDWRWLRKIAAGLAYGLVPACRSKPVVSADRLYSLGRELMERADNDVELKRVERAIVYRDGLMIALLAARPLRRSNFAHLRIGRHLTKAGGAWTLYIPADEAKGRYPIEAPLPQILGGPMDRFLRVYRPRILSLRGRGYLWTSRTGRPLGNGGVYRSIVRRTRTALGSPFSPRDFRVSAATTIAIADPANVHTASLVLGHIYDGTTERCYNRARTVDASLRYQGHLDALRARLSCSS